MKPELLYLLSIEDVIRSPLVRSQTLPLLQELAKNDWRPVLASLYPGLNWLRFHAQRHNLAAELTAMGIELNVTPIAMLTRHFHIPARLLPWYKWQARLVASHLSTRYQSQLIHARSYPAALAGSFLKERSGAKLLFDARSLYILEGEVADEGGKDVLFTSKDVGAWKQEEARLMAISDAVVVVSSPMAEILKQNYPAVGDNIHTIPIATVVPKIDELGPWRRSTRQRLGISPDASVLVYLGSWFEPDLTLPVVKRLQRLVPERKWELLLLLSHAPASLRGEIAERLDFTMPVHLFSAPHSQVCSYLAAADLAILPQADSTYAQSPAYAQRARSVLSIKFTEYLACGLAVLAAHSWAGAAADIIDNHDLGAVYDQLSDEALIAWLQRWEAEKDAFRQRAWRYARDNFDRRVVFAQYQRLYQRLLES